MPAKSKAQQRFFGMIHAYKQGKIRNASKNLREAAKRISDEDAKDFAKTKHDGLPEKAASLTRYEQGFLSKCAEYGLDTETSVALLEKRAALLPALAGFGRSAIGALRSPAAANIGKKIWRGVQGAAGIGSSLYSLSWLAGNVMHGGAGMRENAGWPMAKGSPKPAPSAPKMAPRMPPRVMPKAASYPMINNAYSTKKLKSLLRLLMANRGPKYPGSGAIDMNKLSRMLNRVSVSNAGRDSFLKAASGMRKRAYSVKKELKDIDDYTDRHPVLTPVVGGGAGLKLVTDPRNISKLTGTEHLRHLTQTKNIGSIMDKGLLVAKSLDGDTISSRHGMQDLTRGKIFFGRKKGLVLDPLKIMKIVHTKSNLPTKVLKARIPYDELLRLGPGMDPLHIEKMKMANGVKGFKGKLVRAMLKIDPFGPGMTMTVSKDVSPKFIKGSPKYTQTALKELAGMPKYMLKHPARFAKGLGTVGGGAAMLGLSGYSLKKSIERALGVRPPSKAKGSPKTKKK